MDNIFLQCTFYPQSFTHISLNVENRRNEKDNSDDNYVKKKDNPEKKSNLKIILQFLGMNLSSYRFPKSITSRKSNKTYNKPTV